MYYESFPSKLRAARQKNGFTLREAGAEMHIPYSTLANYEIGRTQPDIETLGKMAEFYGVSIDWLLGVQTSEKAAR